VKIDFIIENIQKKFKDDESISYYGSTTDNYLVEKIESIFRVELPGNVRYFIRKYGAFQIGSYDINFVESELIETCIDWTISIREKYPSINKNFIVIMQNEIIFYLLDCSTGNIFGWESYNEPIFDDFYIQYNNLEEFIQKLAESYERSKKIENKFTW